MMQKNELGLTTAIVTFENLDELLQSLEELSELHSKAVTRYDDRLGQLLRGRGFQGEQSFMMPSGDAVEQAKKAKNDKKGGGEERGWFTLGTEEFAIKVGNNESSFISNEVSALFKVVETLRARITVINMARKLLAELPSRGFETAQRMRVVFKDGVPKQVIPTNEMTGKQRKFRYVEQFQVPMMK
jgi:hypothetical protein